MLRKFRFSLLGLLVFTAIVAVVIGYWFAPFEIELSAKDGEQFGFVSMQYLSDGPPSLEHATSIKLTVRRKLNGEYGPHGPIVCRFKDDQYHLYSRKSHQNETDGPKVYTNLPVGQKFKLGKRQEKFNIEEEYDPPISILSAIACLKSDGKITDPYFYVCSDRSVLYSCEWPGQRVQSYADTLTEASVYGNNNEKLMISSAVHAAIDKELARIK